MKNFLYFMVCCCLLMSSQIYSSPGCMSKSKYAYRCAEQNCTFGEDCEDCCEFCEAPDNKTFYYINCSCPCDRYIQLDNGKCLQCGHVRKVQPIKVVYKN